jgi:hypothetical protein
MSDDNLHWTKSSKSISGGACVELAAADEDILVRNSRQPTQVIRYTRAEILAFFDAVRDREFDHLLGED